MLKQLNNQKEVNSRRSLKKLLFPQVKENSCLMVAMQEKP